MTKPGKKPSPGGKVPKMHDFDVKDRVSITRNGITIGAGEVIETGRIAKGKQLDIMVELDTGAEMPCKPQWLKKLKDGEQIQTIDPRARPNIASPKKMPACLRCHNGNVYEPGSVELYKDGFAHAFQLDGLKNYSHIVLVPKNMFEGRIPRKDRILCETCDRCRFGSVTPVNPGSKGGSSIDHKLLASKGIVSIIFVPLPRK